jgi:hypothetical protein
MVKPLDEVVNKTDCIVILDTCIARELAHEDKCPEWVATYEEMALDGYSFSLSDVAFAELADQIDRDSIKEKDKVRMIERLSRFINQNLPVFLGKRDIIAIIGGKHNQPDWSIKEFIELSKSAWDYLQDNSSNKCIPASEILQEERDHWMEMFKCFAEKNSHDNKLHEKSEEMLDLVFQDIDENKVISNPPESIRCDLQVKLLWRLFLRSRESKFPYDYSSKKKKNDGIDFDLYKYFHIPALVITLDNGFFKSIKDIKSYQKDWFVKPEYLASQWREGVKLNPSWP